MKRTSMVWDGWDGRREINGGRALACALARAALPTLEHVCAVDPRILLIEIQAGTYVPSMNKGLTGKMFGGNVAEVLGGAVADDERRTISSIVQD